MNCSCHICEPEEADKDKEKKPGKIDEKIDADLVQEGSSAAWTLTGAKVVHPQQVANIKDCFTFPLSQILDQDKEKTAKEKDSESKKGRLVGLVVARGRCWTGAWKRVLEITGLFVYQVFKLM